MKVLIQPAVVLNPVHVCLISRPLFPPQALRAVGLCGGHDLIDHQFCQEEGESLDHPVGSAKKKKLTQKKLCHNRGVKRGQESKDRFGFFLWA